MKANNDMPKKKKENDKKKAPKPERVSFKGFWTENFSKEAIVGKWTAYRDSFKGDSDEAKKVRKTAVTKSVLISVVIRELFVRISEFSNEIGMLLIGTDTSGFSTYST